jgi:hypothetical protein
MISGPWVRDKLTKIVDMHSALPFRIISYCKH